MAPALQFVYEWVLEGDKLKKETNSKMVVINNRKKSSESYK